MRATACRRLVALYPALWRREHAEAFTDLLVDTPLTLTAVLDVAEAAAREHHRARPALTTGSLAVLAFAALDACAVRAGITDNILWAPTSPTGVLMLAMTCSPPAWAAYVPGRRGLSARHGRTVDSP